MPLADIRKNFHILTTFADPLLPINVREAIIDFPKRDFLKCIAEICFNLVIGTISVNPGTIFHFA